ncbi:MAG: molybdate ABC transporter substrate-binding protein [Sphingobacteriaceae bacterium]|nr:MAG: molybdate ABC transporter substrate-binding protein [Sphingobacteriaceae bacterium]
MKTNKLQFNTKKYLLKTASVLALLLLPFCTFAQTLKVAAAANLQGVIKVLKADFEQKTKIIIEPIIGASGNLTNQIKNGAPFDVFLSADMSFPENLSKSGFTISKPLVYAFGSLIICSNQKLNFNNWEQLLQSNSIQKIAIANPETAPYGKAAKEVLERKKLLQKVQSKIVYGESISQVNIYLTTGVAQIGFTTEALISDVAGKQKLYWKRVNPTDYQPIKQGMVILKHAEKNAQAQQFYKYMQSAAAKNILKKYGYK